MARFDVHPKPGGGEGYVVDVRADLLSRLSAPKLPTRVVVPVLPDAAVPRPIGGLLQHTRSREMTMRLLLAILLPWLQFFTIGRPFAGIVCLVLQITVVGWIPAAIWSAYALSQFHTDRKIALATRQKR